MAFKVNYNQQRAERNRAKQAKKDAKLREREEEVARRKAGPDAATPATDTAPVADGPATDAPVEHQDGTP